MFDTGTPTIGVKFFVLPSMIHDGPSTSLTSTEYVEDVVSTVAIQDPARLGRQQSMGDSGRVIE